jgi:hypothetical protein
MRSWIFRGVGNLMGRQGDKTLAQAKAALVYDLVGDALSGARCYWDMGVLAMDGSQITEAREQFKRALSLFRKADKADSIGRVLRRLARLEPEEERRRNLVRAAAAAWATTGRRDLMAELDSAFRDWKR